MTGIVWAQLVGWLDSSADENPNKDMRRLEFFLFGVLSFRIDLSNHV